MTGVGAKGSESCCHIILKNIMWGPKPASYQLVFPENSKSCSFCSDFIVSIHGFWPHYFVSSIQNKFIFHIYFSSKHSVPLQLSKDIYIEKQREV